MGERPEGGNGRMPLPVPPRHGCRVGTRGPQRASWDEGSRAIRGGFLLDTFICAVQGCTNVAKRRMRESDLRQKKVPKEKATPSYAKTLACLTGVGPALPDAASCRGGPVTGIPAGHPFGALTQTGEASERSTRGGTSTKPIRVSHSSSVVSVERPGHKPAKSTGSAVS